MKTYLTERTDDYGVIWCGEISAESWVQAEVWAAERDETVVGILILDLPGEMVSDPDAFVETFYEEKQAA